MDKYVINYLNTLKLKIMEISKDVFTEKEEAIKSAIAQANKGGMFEGWHLPIFKVTKGYEVGSWTKNNSTDSDDSIIGIVYSNGRFDRY